MDTTVRTLEPIRRSVSPEVRTEYKLFRWTSDVVSVTTPPFIRLQDSKGLVTTLRVWIMLVMMNALHQVVSGWSNQGTCSTHTRDVNCLNKCGQKTWREADTAQKRAHRWTIKTALKEIPRGLDSSGPGWLWTWSVVCCVEAMSQPRRAQWWAERQLEPQCSRRAARWQAVATSRRCAVGNGRTTHVQPAHNSGTGVRSLSCAQLTVSNGNITDELERIQKEAVVDSSSRCLDIDSNQAPLECKCRGLLLDQADGHRRLYVPAERSHVTRQQNATTDTSKWVSPAAITATLHAYIAPFSRTECHQYKASPLSLGSRQNCPEIK
jgi:hypothetical protein